MLSSALLALARVCAFLRLARTVKEEEGVTSHELFCCTLILFARSQ